MIKEEKLNFLAYCFQIYKENKRLKGKQVLEQFNKFGVTSYIVDHYGALHTFGELYLIDDIDDFIAQHDPKPPTIANQ